MTKKEEADRVAKSLKAAADSRKSLSTPARVGESIFSIVIDGKVFRVAVPWAMVGYASEADISKYILNFLAD